MEKIFIKNRKNQKLSIVFQRVENPMGLVFILHGLGGSKKQPIIETCAETFLKCNYNTIRFDTTNTFGESDGNYENATTTNYYEDLEDVISWAKNSNFYQEPFVLVGHSLGGIAVALYAENYPEKVKTLILFSTVVSGALSLENNIEAIKEWQRTGWRISERKSKPGTFKKLPWSHMEDRLKYDLLLKVKNLTMPVLMIVGEKDESTPVKHQEVLYEALLSKKEFCIIRGADHVFSEQYHLEEVGEILNKWINKIINMKEKEENLFFKILKLLKLLIGTCPANLLFFIGLILLSNLLFFYSNSFLSILYSVIAFLWSFSLRNYSLRDLFKEDVDIFNKFLIFLSFLFAITILVFIIFYILIAFAMAGFF